MVSQKTPNDEKIIQFSFNINSRVLETRMEPFQIIFISNIHSIVSNYTIHRFHRKTKKYEISILALIPITIFIAFYIACLVEHHKSKELVDFIEFLSPVIYRSIYIHLAVGFCSVLLFFSQILNLFIFSKKIADFCRNNKSDEENSNYLKTFWFFYQLCSSTVIMTILTIYNITEIDWELFKYEYVLIMCALNLPHSLSSMILRYFMNNVFIINFHFDKLNQEIEEIERSRGGTQLTIIGNKEFVVEKIENCLNKFLKIEDLTRKLNRTIQFQLIFIIFLHIFVCVISTYLLFHIKNEWEEFMPQHDVLNLKINAITWLILVLNDFFCVVATVELCYWEIRKIKNRITENLTSNWNEKINPVFWKFYLILSEKKIVFKFFYIFEISFKVFLEV